MSDVQLVVGAVVGAGTMGRGMADIAAAADPDAVVASTSSVPITRLAGAVRSPQRFFGVHFFSPAWRMPLIEVIRTVHTDAGVEARRCADAGLRLLRRGPDR